MAQQTEAVREQQPKVRDKIDNSHTRIEATEYIHSNKTLLRTIQQKQLENALSQQAFKQPAGSITPDVANFQHIHYKILVSVSQCPAHEATCHKYGIKATVSQ